MPFLEAAGKALLLVKTWLAVRVGRAVGGRKKKYGLKKAGHATKALPQSASRQFFN